MQENFRLEPTNHDGRGTRWLLLLAFAALIVRLAPLTPGEMKFATGWDAVEYIALAQVLGRAVDSLALSVAIVVRTPTPGRRAIRSLLL